MKKRKLFAMALLSLAAAILLQFAIVRIDQQNQVLEAYVLKEPLMIGQTIELSKCKVIKLVANATEQTNYLAKEDLLKKPKITRQLSEGTVLLKTHLSTDTEKTKGHSMVIKLDDEAAHQGNFQLGELVEVLCYRQGETKRLQNIRISNVELRNQLEEQGFVFTLSGDIRDLETIMLAQGEGIVRIIKKVSIQ